jgi:uncharacterized protein involved in exopolysaccharide biosynthesis
MENRNELSFLNLFQGSRFLVRFLLTKWKMISLISITGLAICLTLSFLLPIKYRSSLSFVVEDDAASMGGLGAIANSFGLGMMGGGTYNTSNIIQYMQMRTLVEKALLSEIPNDLKNRTFAQEYIDAYRINKNWSEDPRLKQMSFKVNDLRNSFSIEKDSILYDIYTDLIEKGRLMVKLRNTESSVIDIQVETRSSVFSQFFPERLVNIVSETYIENKTKKSRTQVASITKQVDSVRMELYNSISGAATSSDEVFGLNPAMNKQRVNLADKQVDVEANTAILKELVKNMEIAKMTLSDQTPIIEVVDRPALPMEKIHVKKTFAVVVGTLLGFLFGVFIYSMKYFFLERMIESN